MSAPFLAFDHVQLAMPQGREDDALLARLRAAGHEAHEDDDLPGTRRAFVTDPFGNRLELIAS